MRDRPASGIGEVPRPCAQAPGDVPDGDAGDDADEPPPGAAAARVRRRRRGTGSGAAPEPSAIRAMSLDIVLPVFNEERALPGAVAVLYDYLERWSPFAWTITIADNASTDATAAVAAELARRRPRVRILRLARKGKGHAIRSAWAASSADIVAYTDVDLSTGLDALLPMVMSLATGHCDLAVGSRLLPGSRTVRSLKREAYSRVYNWLLRLTHRVQFSDAQCGFKAARAGAVRPLLAQIEDRAWFFDSELLLLAEYNGLRVHEMPVDWIEDTDSRVRPVHVATGNLRGLLRVALAKARGTARVVALPRRPAPQAAHPDAVHGVRLRRVPRRTAMFLGLGAAFAAVAALLLFVARAWWQPPTADLAVAVATAWLSGKADWLPAAGAAVFPRPRPLRRLAASCLVGACVFGALLAARAAAPGAGRPAGLLILAAATAAGLAGRFALLQFGAARSD
jgi:Glycosyl transferase family 2